MTNLKLKSMILEKFRYQSDFAQAVGISEDRLSRLIRGRKRPNETDKLRIAKALEVRPEEIFPN